ncbi:MAG TPA: 30S ribosomal protein S13 [Candidatus Thermoplasmatota archaeon]|nr:30S ribosomal protein S13 [Candidatus Thermoplasmatota archaeon]
MAEQKQKDDFRYIVRIANTDLDGNDQVEVALDKVKGIGLRIGALVAVRSGINRFEKIGNLSDDQIAKIQEEVDRIPEFVPTWMLNRAKDVDTGDDFHLVGTDLETKKRDDLNRLKKIRTYRGLRHEDGQKVRGQRSRSNGRTGLTMGVQKKKD